jgi:hypothetical protein
MDGDFDRTMMFVGSSEEAMASPLFRRLERQCLWSSRLCMVAIFPV